MFEELLKRIGASLSRYNIPYMIIGGQAVLLYGEPRLTRDIDITIGLDLDHLKEIVRIVNETGLRILVENIEAFARQTMVIPALDETTGIRVDFILSFTPYEHKAIERARKVNILDQEVSFASAEDVVIHKIFAGRPRDLEDVKNIVIKNPEIDTEYIQTWLKEFDRTLNENFCKTFEGILSR